MREREKEREIALTLSLSLSLSLLPSVSIVHRTQQIFQPAFSFCAKLRNISFLARQHWCVQTQENFTYVFVSTFQQCLAYLSHLLWDRRQEAVQILFRRVRLKAFVQNKQAASLCSYHQVIFSQSQGGAAFEQYLHLWRIPILVVKFPF